MEIRALTPEFLEDYLRFFDDVAFSDHAEWSWCYCTYFHLSKADEKRIEETHRADFGRDVLRNIAIGFINDGTLRGYLAYEGGAVVGWLNAQDKRNYAKIRESAELMEGGEGERIMAVTCFIVAPDARRKGIATALLNRVVEDAAREGCDFVEAYPANGELDCFQHYHGHAEMYEKCGFALFKPFEHYSIYRKALK